MHADGTFVLAESIGELKSLQPIISFGIVNQNVNVGKNRCMYLGGHDITKEGSSILINDQLVSHTSEELYLGCYITDDDNLLSTSIEHDITKRSSEVMIKYRSFINNNPREPIHIRLKVFLSYYFKQI